MTTRTWRRRVDGAIGAATKRSEKQRVPCLMPGCGESAIRSHSQQRAGALRAIAVDRKVYRTCPNIYRKVKRADDAMVEKASIAEASRFRGFCAGHDHEIFAPIETRELHAGDPEQAFLLSLRAVNYEQARKRQGVVFMDTLERRLGAACPDAVRLTKAGTVNHFNQATVLELMCRTLVSVGWDGRLYDCDFNQMLELELGAARAIGARNVWDIRSLADLAGTRIATGSHCLGCTAGAGSSCGGALQ